MLENRLFHLSDESEVRVHRDPVVVGVCHRLSILQRLHRVHTAGSSLAHELRLDWQRCCGRDFDSDGALVPIRLEACKVAGRARECPRPPRAWQEHDSSLVEIHNAVSWRSSLPHRPRGFSTIDSWYAATALAPRVLRSATGDLLVGQPCTIEESPSPLPTDSTWTNPFVNGGLRNRDIERHTLPTHAVQ